MSRALMQQTTVHFSVQIETDNEAALIEAIGLAILPFMLIWQLWQVGQRWTYEVRAFCQDVTEAVRFVSAVFVIGFRAWAWACWGYGYD